MTASGSTSSEPAQPVIELDVSAVRGRLAAHRRAQETGRQAPPGSPGCPPAGTRPSGARSGPRRGFPKRFRPAGLHRAATVFYAHSVTQANTAPQHAAYR